MADEATAKVQYPARVFIHSDAGSRQTWAEVVNGWTHRRVLREREQWIFHRSKWALGEGRSGYHLSEGVISEEVFNEVWAKAWNTGVEQASPWDPPLDDPGDSIHRLWPFKARVFLLRSGDFSWLKALLLAGWDVEVEWVAARAYSSIDRAADAVFSYRPHAVAVDIEGRHVPAYPPSESLLTDGRSWDGRTVQDPADVAHALECAAAIRKIDPGVPILYVGDTELDPSVRASLPDGIRVRPQHLLEYLDTVRAAGTVDCSARRRAQQR